MKRCYFFLLLAFLFVSGNTLFAEENVTQEEGLTREQRRGQEQLEVFEVMEEEEPRPVRPGGQIEEEARQSSRALALDNSSILNATTDLFALIDFVGRKDPEIISAVKQFIIAQFERERQILQERRDVLKKQYAIGIIIFATVHIMVIVGTGTAMFEFRQAHNARKRAKQQATDIQISLEGIALKTSLQGILLLAFALAFYLLYLKLVFPVTILK